MTLGFTATVFLGFPASVFLAPYKAIHKTMILPFLTLMNNM